MRIKSADRWRLAVQGLHRRPTRTLLTLLGLVVAMTSMLLFLSLGQGLQGQLRAEIRSVVPDLQVAQQVSGLSLLPSPNLPPEVLQTLRTRGAALGITQITPVVAQIKQDLDPSQSAVYYGLPAGQGIQALFAQVRPAQGRLLEAEDEGRAVAVLGATAARNLSVGVGGQFSITRRSKVRVVGVLQPLGNLTDTFTFLPLTSAQRAFGTGKRLSFVALNLRDPEQAPQVAAQLRGLLHLEVSTRSDVLHSSAQILRSADTLSLCLSLVALVVGGLAVSNTMLMTIHERTPEFGTLRAIGARPSFVTWLVLSESLLLALLGWAGSVLLSVPGVWGINQLTQHLVGIDGAVLTPRLMLLSLGLSVLLGVLAGWWPAWQAGRVRITQALGQI